jgi:hypothetical protein
MEIKLKKYLWLFFSLYLSLYLALAYHPNENLVNLLYDLDWFQDKNHMVAKIIALCIICSGFVHWRFICKERRVLSNSERKKMINISCCIATGISLSWILLPILFIYMTKILFAIGYFDYLYKINQISVADYSKIFSQVKRPLNDILSIFFTSLIVYPLSTYFLIRIGYKLTSQKTLKK